MRWSWRTRADDVIFADYPMFHIAGFFGRGYLRHRARHVDRHSVAARRARQALHRELLEVRRTSSASRCFSGVPTTLAQLAKSRPRGEELGSLAPLRRAPARPRSRPRSRGRSRSLIGVRVLLTYGATEYTQNVTQAPRDGDPQIRLARHPPALHAGQDGRARRRADQARMRRRRDRRGRREGAERHAGLSRAEATTRACSRATAGSIPAISGASTPTAISGSPAAPRTSSSAAATISIRR